MRCPKCCHENTSVLDSREVDDDRVVRRRRTCNDCNTRFTTYERVEVVNLMIRKQSGALEPYDRAKLAHGIWISLAKRGKTKDVVNKMLDRLEERWGSTPDKEIGTDQIGTDVLDLLRDIDEVAFIRFASVHRKFKDIKEFTKELDKLVG